MRNWFKFSLLAPLLTLLAGVEASLADIPNQAQTPGTLLSHNAPEMGRLAIIELLGDYVITVPEKPSSPAGSDFLVRAWDISNPDNPTVVGTFGETEHPFLAHGLIKSGRELYIGGYPNDAIRLEDDGSLTHTTWTGPEGHWGKSGMNRPWAAKDFWTYNSPSGNAWLSLDDEVVAEWDHLGQTGVMGFPMFMGDLMIYASDQSNTGVATYDISDPQNPRLLDVLNTSDIHPTIKNVSWDGIESDVEWGIGGYWSEIYGHYVVFARRNDNPGIQVVDFSDPNNLELHCDFLVKDPSFGVEPDSAGQYGNPMYLGFQDEYAFAERFKLNIETCEVELVLDEISNQVETNQYSRPLGNLVATGGSSLWVLDNNPAGMGLWAHQADPDTRAPYVAYHIPENNQSNFPVFAPISLMIPETLRSETIIEGETLRLAEVGGDEVPIVYVLSHAGMLTVDPVSYLEPGTTYELTISGVQDAVANEMEVYSFRFSTGDSVDLSGATNSAPIITSLTVDPSGTVAVDESVSVTVLGSDPDGDALEYRFLSEGQNGGAYGDWSSGSSAVYTYDSAGVYRINVQARDTEGTTTTATRNITVSGNTSASGGSSSVPEASVTMSSTPVAYSYSSSSIWVVNPDNNTLSELSEDGAILGEYDAGEDPRSVAIAEDSTVWVTSFGDDQVRVFDSSGSLLQTIDTGYGTAPYGIAFSPDSASAYVSLYGSGEILKINSSSRAVDQTLTLPADTDSDMRPTPRAIAISVDGSRLLATRFVSGENWGEVYSVDLGSFSYDTSILLRQSVEPDDLDTGRGLPNYLSSVVISQDGLWAYVAGTKDNIGGGLQNGNTSDIDDDNTVRTFLSTIYLGPGSEHEHLWKRIDFDNADSPSALLLAPNDNYLFALLQGSNEVVVLSRNETTGALSTSSVAQFGVGLAPQGMTIDVVTGNAYIKNFTDRTITAFDLQNFLSAGQLNPSMQTFSTVSLENLDEEVLKGKQIFYNAANGLEDNTSIGLMSAEGYISCATCHVDGGQNGRTYDFTGRGEGLRNNISMKGRSGTRFGNVHWSANFDEIQDFEHDIRQRFLGEGLMTDADFSATDQPLGGLKAGLSEDLDALAAYVESLNNESLAKSPYRESELLMTSAATDGQQVFVASGCADCHTGKAYTDGLTHDVGTSRDYSGDISEFKTPSLLGLHATAPYLHDGRAAKLEDVFTKAGGLVFQAEDGQLSGNVSLVSVQDRSSLRDGGGARLDAGSSVSISMISDSAGFGFVHLRYGSASDNSVMGVVVNGDEQEAGLSSLPQVWGWDVAFKEVTFEVEFAAGQNTIEVSAESGAFLLDDITVSAPDQLDVAVYHTMVLALPATDQDSLIEFLMQLDRSDAPSDTEDPFAAIEIDVIEDPVDPVEQDDEGWVFCSSEGDYCSFNGEREVRYGAEGVYAFVMAESGVDCSNDFFGDPIPGVVKACDYSVDFQSPALASEPDAGGAGASSLWIQLLSLLAVLGGVLGRRNEFRAI